MYLDGDPTEGAMFVAALKAGLTREQLHERVYDCEGVSI